MLYKISGIIEAIVEDTVLVQQGTLNTQTDMFTSSGLTWEVCVSKYSIEYYSNFIDSSSLIHIYVWVYSTDKDLMLFGFHSLAERSVFLTLIKVNGIGPKMALKILSNVKPEIILSYIRSQDVQLLSKIPGIGNKKASTILLALEGKYIPSVLQSKVPSTTLTKVQQEMIEGLVSMGYVRENIVAIIEEIGEEGLVGVQEGEIMSKIIVQLESKQ